VIVPIGKLDIGALVGVSMIAGVFVDTATGTARAVNVAFTMALTSVVGAAVPTGLLVQKMVVIDKVNKPKTILLFTIDFSLDHP
jgi:hypothetical protein